MEEQPLRAQITLRQHFEHSHQLLIVHPGNMHRQYGHNPLKEFWARFLHIDVRLALVVQEVTVEEV